MDEILTFIQMWLSQDQYEYGEFGKHEIVNPTDLPRTFEVSLMKPNIFSSLYAYYALASTGAVTEKTETALNGWLSNIRSEDGYWTSASGVLLPFDKSIGWARNKNLRHTAKCLDYYLLCKRFSFEDAKVFNEIITTQMESGAYPQFLGNRPDIWSTAYFANLLIRATMDENLFFTCPRSKTQLSWKNELCNRLNRSIDWLISQISTIDNLWHIEGGNSISISLAMMMEIGGFLAINRSEQCKEIVNTLMRTGNKSYSLLYISCLTIDILDCEMQKKIIDELTIRMADFDKYTPIEDLINAVGLCRLSFFSKNINNIQYYRDKCNGHESLLVSIHKLEDDPEMKLKNKNLFLFVTANEHEREAFELRFHRHKEKYILGKTYYIGEFGRYPAAYVHMDAQGVTDPAATPLVSLLVSELNPSAVVMVGIAFGADETTQKIGDVLVSDKILPYDSQKLLQDRTEYKEIPKEVGFQLLNAFREHREWAHQLSNSKQSIVHVGAILTGSRLINNYDYRTQLLEDFAANKPIGGEMEAQGIYSMCRLHGVSEWIIVKGICDWGYKKDNPNKEQDQKTAALSAVEYCYHVFSRYGVFDSLV